MAGNITETTDGVSALQLTPATSSVATQTPLLPSRKTFNSLSVDLKSLIIEQLLRPSDLKNVCLVSSQLHEITVRFLYRNVSLDLGCTNDCRLSAFLNPKNKGLKYVRQIRLYLANIAIRCNQEQQAAFATRMIIELMPENILEEFSWCPWRPFSADNLLLLYRKQKSLRWLECMQVDREILPELKTNTAVTSGIFDSSRKLALYPENMETLETAGYYVERTSHHLEELIVHANFPSTEDGSDPSRTTTDQRQLNDTATGPGLLTRTLFAKMLPFEECTPFAKLTSLRLHRINLRYAVDTWCKVVNFKQCRNLRFYHCAGVDSMFGQLCKAANLPMNLQTLEVQHRDNHENEALLALDGFLCLVKGLRELIIDIHGVKQLPDSTGISKHGKTLELLNIHASPEGTSAVGDRSEVTNAEEHVYSVEDYEKICESCPGLVQVSCAWPATSLIRSRTESWKSYGAAISKHLRLLVTLHISTWPNNKPSSQLLPRAVFEALLQRLATKLFQQALEVEPGIELVPGKLHLIAFGIHDRIYEREDSSSQISYIRSTAIDSEGRSQLHAAQISWCLRNFVEPRSDVLDTVLGRDIKPPFKADARDFTLDDADGWDDDV